MKEDKSSFQTLAREEYKVDSEQPTRSAHDASQGVTEPGTAELTGVFFALLAASFLTMFFCCVHSPFYRYSVYQDANIFMAVGQAMKQGLMPYRDVFDHKGILLYLINYFAATIFPKSMTGVYVFLSVSLSVFMFFSYRIARIFLPSVPALIAAFLMFSFSIGNTVYSDGGGSAEEYFLPCIAGCLFYLIRSFNYAQVASEKDARRFFRGSAIVGILCGVMLWIKYTMIPAVGLSFLILYVFLLSRKRVGDVVRSLGAVFLGLLIVSVPCVIYLVSQGILDDMWEVYVVFNARYGGGGWRFSDTFINISNYWTALLLMLCSLLGLFYLRFRTKVISGAGAWSVFSMIISTVLIITAVGRFYMYYFLVLVPFLIFATISAVFFVRMWIRRGKPDRFGKKVKIVATGAVIAAILIECVSMSVIQWSLGSVFSPKTDLEYCADAINEHWARAGNGKPPKILSLLIGEKGLMQLCHTYPQHKFFYMPNILEEESLRIAREQIGYVKAEAADYVFLYGGGDVIYFMKSANPNYRAILVRGGRDGDPEEFLYIFALDETRGTDS